MDTRHVPIGNAQSVPGRQRTIHQIFAVSSEDVRGQSAELLPFRKKTSEDNPQSTDDWLAYSPFGPLTKGLIGKLRHLICILKIDRMANYPSVY